MQQETIKFYTTIFDAKVKKDEEYYSSFYSVKVHSNGLKSVITSNLNTAGTKSDSNIIIDDNIKANGVDDIHGNGLDPINDDEYGSELQNDEIVMQLIEHGIKLFSEAIEFPLDKVDTTSNEALEEYDITNIGRDRVKSVGSIDFHKIDEELRLEFISNVLKILRILITSIQSINSTNNSHKLHRVVPTDKSVNYNLNKHLDHFFKLNEWFLIKLLPSFDMEQVNQLILIIVKEIIYFLYDYIFIVKHSPNDLENMKAFEFGEILNDILVKTHPKVTNQEFEIPTITLSVETSIKIFIIIAILNNGKIFITKFNHFILQFDHILKLNLKLAYGYSRDLLNYQDMNDSFFHWMTGNILNFGNEYINNKYITSIDINQPQYTNNEELTMLLNTRLKTCKFQNLDNFEIKELLPVSLYIHSFFDDELFINEFLNNDHEIFQSWLCLLSYSLQYQYKSKSSVIMTRLSILIINKLLPNLQNLTINECKWKLCHQKSPIIKLNNGNNDKKPITSYILDNLLILLRFNLNKKLNISNFSNAIKLMHIIISKQIDEQYNYIELIKIVITLLNFNESILQKSELTNEILKLFNNLLSLSIKVELIYEILLNFEKFFKIPGIENYPNLIILKQFLHEKFELGPQASGSVTTKIRPGDLEFDSPEFVKTIRSFDGDLKLFEIPMVQIDIQDIIRNI